MSLTVLVTAKNNAETIRECLRRIQQAPPSSKEIVVVYARSTDDTESILRGLNGVKLIMDNEGTGSAINTGVLNSKGDIIIYIEAHSFVADDTLLTMMQPFKEDPNVGYVVCYRYIPNNLRNLSTAQKLMNLWRRVRSPNSTMGQFRAFRRETFFDVGGFWTFPKAADDLEFATRLMDTKWKMEAVRTKAWDLPRRSLYTMLGHELEGGRSVSCWFHLYWAHPKTLMEYHLRRNSLVILHALGFLVFRRLFLSPIRGLRIAVRERQASFFPFYVAVNWVNVLGFFLGKWKWWGKETWDQRVTRKASV